MKTKISMIIAFASAVLAGLMTFAQSLDPSILDLFK